jgi:hypothetical protein
VAGKTMAQARCIVHALLSGQRVYLIGEQNNAARCKMLVGEILKNVGADQRLLENLIVRSTDERASGKNLR